MKHVTIILLIATSTISFWVGRFEECQCFLLMALLYNTIWNDLDKSDKKEK